jgi:hypothetical protein
MEGVGDLVDVEMPHELVHSFDMTDQWIIAEEPQHTLPAAIDPVRQEIRKLPGRLTGEKLRQYISARKKGAGLGLPCEWTWFDGRACPSASRFPCG